MLKLNGKPLLLRPPSPSTIRLIQTLNRKGANAIFLTDKIAQMTEIAPSYFGNPAFIKQKCLAPYTVRAGKLRYWGNPKAIVAFRKQVKGCL